MAAAMNGIAVHGGLIPYGGTFLTFTDYARPAIRLSALMEAARHLCDDARLDRPRRGRPDAPAGRASGGAARDPAPARVPPGRRGRDRRMLGAGAEAPARAVDAGADPAERAAAAHRGRSAREPLGAAAPTCWPRPRARRAGHPARDRLRGVGSRWTRATCSARTASRAAVVSMPCWELFEAQPEDYRSAVLGTAPRVAVEAAVRLGWDRWLGERGAFVGMTGFGASAPGRGALSRISASPRKRSPRPRGRSSDPGAGPGTRADCGRRRGGPHRSP